MSSPGGAYAPVEFDRATLKLKRGGAAVDHAAEMEEISRMDQEAAKMDNASSQKLKAKLQASRIAINQFLKSQ